MCATCSADDSLAGTDRDILCLRAGLAVSDLSLDELWLRHIATGGSSDLTEFGGIVSGRLQPSRLQHDIIAVALNEHFMDEARTLRVAYHPL